MKNNLDFDTVLQCVSYIPLIDIAHRGNILLNSKGGYSVSPFILHSFVNELVILIRNINNLLHTYCVMLGFLALLEP